MKRCVYSIAVLLVDANAASCGTGFIRSLFESGTVNVSVTRPPETDVLKGIGEIVIGQFQLTSSESRSTYAVDFSEELEKALLHTERFVSTTGGILNRLGDVNGALSDTDSGTVIITGQVNVIYTEEVTRFESKETDEKTKKVTIIQTITNNGNVRV